MALPDIKDAGLLAHFEIWGWPYHGLCTSGVIDLAGSLTKTITTPAHGSAWLIDRGLDPIVRTSGQLTVDASLGHEWRNYGLISGGVVHGTQLGANKYIHVDEAGKRWLITVGTHTIGLTTNQVGLRFTIVQFGLFGEGVKTPIVVDKIVSCHDITWSMYGYTYEGSEVLLEDVWTSGAKALVSFGLTRTSTPSLKDLFSVMEVVITGSGGADGSGLVISASEVMQDTELSQSIVDSTTPINHTVAGSGSYTGSAPTYTIQWDSSGVYWQTVAVIDNGRGGSTGSLAYNIDDSYTYARFAFYDASGNVKAARIKKMLRAQNTKTGTSYSSEGSLVANNLNCTDGTPVVDTYYHDDAALIANTTCLEDYTFGIYLLENDTVVDYLEVHQSVSITQHWKKRVSAVPPAPSLTFVCNEWDVLDYSTSGGGIYQKNLHPATWNAAEWRGSLASALGLPAAPDIRDGWGDPDPMALNDLVLAWRSKTSNHLASGSAAVIGTVELGIQRIDAKSAAFYKPGTTRTYGTVMTPLGNKTASLTPAGNLYFAWQRKTGDFTFSASPICYV